jgi:tetratricopeptide (TPR) repeat protein
MALYRGMTGAPGEAAALLEAAEKRYHGGTASTRAWLRLQRALVALDQGRLDEALALLRLAADALPGWWLVDEHVAEIGWLQGDGAGARALLERLIAQHGQPEHMDALAQLLRDGGQPDAALPWIARAQAIHQQRLQAFPEAGIGHAVEHFLQFGPPEQALALARRNAELRPYGDAQITLAAALFRAGRAREAARWIRHVQASEWNTPRLHVVAAQVHAALGAQALADAHEARALAMNRYAKRLYSIAPPRPDPSVASTQ